MTSFGQSQTAHFQTLERQSKPDGDRPDPSLSEHHPKFEPTKFPYDNRSILQSYRRPHILKHFSGILEASSLHPHLCAIAQWWTPSRSFSFRIAGKRKPVSWFEWFDLRSLLLWNLSITIGPKYFGDLSRGPDQR